VNQTSRTTYSSSSAQLVDKFNFQLKFGSFDSWTKFDEWIVESIYKL